MVKAPCDKCGKTTVPWNNVYTLLRESGDLQGFAVLLAPNRHLLPEGDCPGSPSRAQYLKGQPHDPRYPYAQELEDRFRPAYTRMTAWPRNLPDAELEALARTIDVPPVYDKAFWKGNPILAEVARRFLDPWKKAA